MKTNELNIMDLVYTDGIQYASKNEDCNAMIWLKCFQAKTLSKLPNPPVDAVKQIMEEVLRIGLHLATAPGDVLYHVVSVLGKIYYNEALQKVNSGVNEMLAGIGLIEGISRIECEQVPDQLLILPPWMYLARYYSRQGRERFARLAVRNSLQLSLEILSDDDLSNDIWAFIKIGNITSLFLDEKNTATAYAMEAFGFSALKKNQNSLEDGTEKNPDKVERKWLCVSICDSCGWKGENPGGLWVCADCIEINLCNDCREKLHKGEFVKNLCDASHKGFYVDEWDPERLGKVPVGYVPWGDKDITMEDWKNMLREKYLPRT
ncbi:uncharacterized protein N7469_005874 [Penicillium citrinum]|uniref:Uncharacterized protein n=1 Tax=Penicillium citrinum TaxID=5077 RepID=A0A9W9NWW8_PENCI|nr:uncharacterized protein N7469_005874 [Penicillium citrinum]KAJ5231286.1 hypothetical protein N7469_005874 [Penicillium citrinum]